MKNRHFGGFSIKKKKKMAIFSYYNMKNRHFSGFFHKTKTGAETAYYNMKNRRFGIFFIKKNEKGVETAFFFILL